MFANNAPAEAIPDNALIIPLTKEEISNKIKNIYNTVDLFNSPSHLERAEEKGIKKASWSDYYNLIDDIPESELISEKWRTYIYLRKCILDYREKKPDQELTRLLAFLEMNNKNKAWLAEKLLDKPEKEQDECWNTGKHEWLERSLIIEVLKRSAGMVPNVESETEPMCLAPTFDWLYVQAALRSPTKYIFFNNEENVIKSGHVGAVKSAIGNGNKGAQTVGSPGFHDKLVQAFNESTKIASFIKRVSKIFKNDTISGKKAINPDVKCNYVVTGAPTNNANKINEFREQELLPKGNRKTKLHMKHTFMWANRFDSGRGNLSASSSDNESSEDEVKEIDDNLKKLNI